MANPDFQQFMEILRQLPQVQDLVFRGHPALTGPVSPFVTNGLVSASRDARVGSENFSTPVLLCIVSATGRVLGPLSRHADDQEVSILPGLLLAPMGQFQLGSLSVVVLDEVEVSPSGSWVEPTRGGKIPRTVEEILSYTESRVTAAISGPAVAIASPGKFVSPLLPSPRASR